MQIHIAKNGQQLGPYTEEQLGGLLQNGQVSYDDLVWTEGMTDWQPLRTICSPPQGTPPPPPPAFPSVTGTPTALPRLAPSSQTSGKNNSYVVSILAIMFGILCAAYVDLAYANSPNPGVERKYMIIFMFLACSAAAYGYLLPSWIAGKRRLPNFWFILLLNLVTGATGIAWLVCLFWVCFTKSPVKSAIVSGTPQMQDN